MPFSYIFLYILLFVGLNKHFILASYKKLFFFILFVISSFLSLYLGSKDTSLTSWLLILFIYLPVVFQFRDSESYLTPTLSFFRTCLYILAIVGIAQFFIQFITSPPWLFNFSTLFPSWILMGTNMNTSITIADHFKSNGFFVREPSTFSQLVALAILIEINIFRNWKRLPILILALLLTFSGTGLLFLGFGLLFPFNAATVVRLFLTAIVAMFIYVALGKSLGLDDTLNRSNEFSGGVGVQTSSGFARFIAPGIVVSEGARDSIGHLLFGHGSGSISRTITGFAFHDPTWAKLLFEYGLLGTLAFVTLFKTACSDSFLPSPIIAGWTMQYFALGGHLLTLDIVVIPLVFLVLLAKRSSKDFATIQRIHA